jgi:eukaryotic-like serine/threonine-protein kinase
MRGFSAHLAMRFAADTLPVRASALRVAPARPAAAHVSRQTAAAPSPVLGRWQLVRQISTDEHTILYEARPITQRADAPADYLVKVARQDSGGIAAALLWREQAVAHSASHPHLAAILDGKVRGMTPFLVLANVGTPLSSSAYAPGHLRLALWRTRQTSAALAALHAAGWIHARLSPAALLVSPRGHLTVHELGWARRIGSEECRGEHLLAADLRYVAPEMLCDATELTPACDVYCLGLLLIELLIGRPAVDAVVGWQAALAHMRGEIADVRDLRSGLPTALADLICQLTAREPLRRPSMDQVHRQLLRLEISHLGRAQGSAGAGNGTYTPAPS